MNKGLRARLLFAFSMVMFGTIPLFVRHIGLSSGEQAFCRAFLATVLIGIYMIVTKTKIDFRRFRKEIPLLMVTGMIMGFNWVLLFQAYRYTTVSVATLSYSFAQVIVMVACPLLFKEKLTWRQIVCFIMSTVGLFLVIGVGDLSSGSSHLKGVLFGLTGALCYATVILVNKFIKGVDGIPRAFLQLAAAAMILLPYVLSTSGLNLNLLDMGGWACLLTLGLIHTGVLYCIYFSTLKEIPGHKAAIFSYLEPLGAMIISVSFLDEKMTLLQVVGGMMILGFTLWDELAGHKAQV